MQTILIVDDEIAFLEIMQLILQRAGYRIITASHGLQALEMIQVHRPDLVLMDDMLPGMNGGEVCQIVKNDYNLCHTPVILFSAGARVHNPTFIECVNANGVLFKPFKPDDVLRVVRDCLQAPA